MSEELGQAEICCDLCGETPVAFTLCEHIVAGEAAVCAGLEDEPFAFCEKCLTKPAGKIAFVGICRACAVERGLASPTPKPRYNEPRVFCDGMYLTRDEYREFKQRGNF